MRVGDFLKYLKREWNRKEWGQGVGALERGDGTPLQAMVSVKKFNFQSKNEVYILTQESHCFKFGYEGVSNKRKFKYKETVTFTY